MTAGHRRAVRAFDVSNRDVLALAIPMTLAYLSTPILGVVDTAVVGQLGSAALVGGIAMGSILFDLVYSTFGFLRTGTTGLTAQAFGSGEAREGRAILIRSLILATLLGLLVVAAHTPLLDLGLYLMKGSDEVQAATRDYFSVRVLSSPFALGNYAILGWVLGQGRATTGLLIQTFLNGVNILLSILFVMVFEWGIAGCAYATVLSEIAAFVLGAMIVRRSFAEGPFPSRSRIFNRKRFARAIAVNRDIMIRSFTLLFAFAFFTSRSAIQGDTMLAANAILEKFFIVGGYFLDGFATAAEQITGRAIGARYRPAFDRAVKLTVLWGFVLAGAAAVVFWFGGPLLIDLMTTHEGARTVAREYLFWAALTPLFGVLAFEMDGIFIGATWSRDMRNMMLLSLAVYLVTYYLAFPVLGNHGLWLALEVFLGIRGLSLSWMCRIRAREVFPAQPAIAA